MQTRKSKTPRQAVFLMEKAEFLFFEIPIFPNCPDHRDFRPRNHNRRGRRQYDSKEVTPLLAAWPKITNDFQPNLPSICSGVNSACSEAVTGPESLNLSGAPAILFFFSLNVQVNTYMYCRLNVCTFQLYTFLTTTHCVKLHSFCTHQTNCIPTTA